MRLGRVAVVIFAALAVSAHAQARDAAAVPLASQTIRYSLEPGRMASATQQPLHVQRLGRATMAAAIEPEAVRDRFDVRALPFDRLRVRETMKAGFQLRVTGDAGGLDTSFDVAGPVSSIMRHALR